MNPHDCPAQGTLDPAAFFDTDFSKDIDLTNFNFKFDSNPTATEGLDTAHQIVSGADLGNTAPDPESASDRNKVAARPDQDENRGQPLSLDFDDGSHLNSRPTQQLDIAELGQIEKEAWLLNSNGHLHRGHRLINNGNARPTRDNHASTTSSLSPRITTSQLRFGNSSMTPQQFQTTRSLGSIYDTLIQPPTFPVTEMPLPLPQAFFDFDLSSLQFDMAPNSELSLDGTLRYPSHSVEKQSENDNKQADDAMLPYPLSAIDNMVTDSGTDNTVACLLQIVQEQQRTINLLLRRRTVHQTPTSTPGRQSVAQNASKQHFSHISTTTQPPVS